MTTVMNTMLKEKWKANGEAQVGQHSPARRYSRSKLVYLI